MKMPKTILKNLFLSLLVAALSAPVVAAQGRSYTVQIASAETEAEARAVVSELKSKGIEAYWVKADVPGKGIRYRVRIGKFKTQANAKGAADQAISRNLIKEFIITPYETPTVGAATSDSEVARETKTKTKPELNTPSDNRINSPSDRSNTINIEKTKILKENTEEPTSSSPPAASPTTSKDLSKTVTPPTESSSSTTAPAASAPKTNAQTKTAKSSVLDDAKVGDDAKAGMVAATTEPAIATPAVAAASGDIAI